MQKRPGGLRVLSPKPPLGGFTKAMDPGRTEPSRRSGKTHGFCVTGGIPPIASEPTPSPRLWATAPGATPARLCEHTMRAGHRPSKEELSTWLGVGTFYLAPTPKWRSKWRSKIERRLPIRCCSTVGVRAGKIKTVWPRMKTDKTKFLARVLSVFIRG